MAVLTFGEERGGMWVYAQQLSEKRGSFKNVKTLPEEFHGGSGKPTTDCRALRCILETYAEVLQSFLASGFSCSFTSSVFRLVWC